MPSRASRGVWVSFTARTSRTPLRRAGRTSVLGRLAGACHAHGSAVRGWAMSGPGHGLAALFEPTALCQYLSEGGGVMRVFAAVLSGVTGAVLILMALFKSDAVRLVRHGGSWLVLFGLALLVVSSGILLWQRWETWSNDKKRSVLSRPGRRQASNRP